jgi:diguanylate cyclase (GGDEF)-like protein
VSRFTSQRVQPPPVELGSDDAVGELGLVMRGFGHVVGAAAAVLSAPSDAREPAKTLATWSAEDSHVVRPGWGGGLRDSVLAHGETVAGTLGPPGHPSLLIAAESGLVDGAAAPVPLPSERRPGALCAGFAEPLPPEAPETRSLIESYAALVRLCLDDHRVVDGLLAVASRDELTGCLNFGGARRALSAEISRAGRHRLQLSCGFIDLDGFKGVNDRHGHMHGNRILAAVAAGLRRRMRGEDLLARFGGDEFIVIFPHTRARLAGRIAERLRDEVWATTEDLDEPLTASVGITKWRPGMSVDQTLTAAVRAMYLAKADGGIKVY